MLVTAGPMVLVATPQQNVDHQLRGIFSTPRFGTDLAAPTERQDADVPLVDGVELVVNNKRILIII
jgi:hypothetical protein